QAIEEGIDAAITHIRSPSACITRTRLQDRQVCCEALQRIAEPASVARVIAALCFPRVELETRELVPRCRLRDPAAYPGAPGLKHCGAVQGRESIRSCAGTIAYRSTAGQRTAAVSGCGRRWSPPERDS